MKKKMAVLFLLLGAALRADDKPSLRDLDETYRPVKPTAEANATDDTVNAWLAAEPLCQFYPDDSWSVLDGVVQAKPLTKIVAKDSTDIDGNARALLGACQQLKETLGPDRVCKTVEFAGHANGISIGMGKTFGFRAEKGKWNTFPADKELFRNLVKCFQGISDRSTKMVFATCGGATCDEPRFPHLEGLKLFYPMKQEAQQLLSDVMNRDIVSALGGVSSCNNGKGACSNKGWFHSKPSDRLPRLPLTDDIHTQLENPVPVHAP